MIRIFFATMLYMVMVAGSCAPLAAGSYQFKSSSDVKANLSLVVLVGLPSTQHSSGWMWGADTSNAGVSVLDVAAKIGKESVFVPLSAYSDLANPSEIALVEQGKIHVLIIKGGDASTAYKASLSFKDGNIFARRVESGEFPDEVHEETTYHFNLLRN